MRESTARRMGFPRRRKGRENGSGKMSSDVKAFAEEVERKHQSEEYKRRERMLLEADAMEKEVKDFYDFGD